MFIALYRHTHPTVVSRGASATSVALMFLGAIAAAPSTILAQPASASGDGYFFARPVFSLTIRGGLDRPTASSEVWNFTTTNLTVGKGDFIGAGYSADLGFRVANRLDIVLSAGSSRRSADSEFRNFIDNNDLPIEQTTTIRRIPVTLGLRYALRAPEERISRFAWIPSRVTPWIGAGGGAMSYSFTQTGDFVDFQSLNVFSQAFNSRGTVPMAYGNAGIDVKLSMRISLTGDVRYSHARAPLGGAFVGFDKIDLSGTAATMGLTVRM
ncbi:MAG: hypothetical protein H7099_04430 [Gemmatimonadaceae bacterium]|nr:hypothetical protein [Gemmatimonadaceae bacterium]